MPEEAPRIRAQGCRVSAIVASLDDPVGAKTIHGRGVVAGFREDLAGVLAKARWRPADRDRGPGELERAADLVDGTEHRVPQRDTRARGDGVRRLEGLADVADRAGRNPGGVQLGEPVGARPRREPTIEDP